MFKFICDARISLFIALLIKKGATLEKIQFHVNEFKKISGQKNHSARLIKEAIDHMRIDGRGRFQYYEGGIVRGIIKTKYFFIKMSELLTQFQIKTLLKLKSKHAVNLYLLAKRNGEHNFSIAYTHLKKEMGIESYQYASQKDFKNRIINKSCESLRKNTDMKIDFYCSKTNNLNLYHFIVS